MKRTGNKLLTNVQPTFTTVPSTLPLGDQLADISMGWDGTVWSIDTKGVPHQLDPVSQTWHLFGRGFDAVARSPQSGLEMLFRGTQYSDNGSAPQAIGSTWPNLPDSFKLGVTGAANVNNVLYLFRSGRYVRVDQSTNVLSLTSLTNWPKTTNWQQGVIDAVGSDLNNAQNPQILLFRRQEFIVVDMVKKQVVSGPQPLSARFSGKLLQVMSAGFDALLFDVFGTPNHYYVFQGPIRWASPDGQFAGPDYADYVSEWLPRLAQAPSGHIGNLWSVNTYNQPLYHDGANWQQTPQPYGAQAISVAVGVDDSVFAVADDAGLHEYRPTQNNWNMLATAPGSLSQVDVGDASHVWVRDSQHQVHRYTGGDSGTFSQINLGGPVTDMVANADGTLWHCNANAKAANVYRFISEGTQPSQSLSVGEGVTNVTKVASLGFGTAYVLAQQQGQSQLYSYDSPYLFKTAQAYNTAWGGAANMYSKVIALGDGRMFVAANDQDGSKERHVVALDTHSGQECWRTPFSKPVVAIVYDARLHLVYVRVWGGQSLVALKVDSGATAWTYNADAGNLVFKAAVNGNQLCVGYTNRDSTRAGICCIDTDLALQQAGQNKPITAQWSCWLDSSPGQLKITHTPLFDAENVYVAYPSVGTITVSALNRQTGQVKWTRQVSSPGQADLFLRDLTIGQIAFEGQMELALLVSGQHRIVAFRLSDDGQTTHSYNIPSSPNVLLTFTTSIAVGSKGIYVGDDNGTLYVLDANLHATKQITVSAKAGIRSTPIPFSDSQGNEYVALTTDDHPVLWLIDPFNGEPPVTLATQQTILTDLTLDAASGMLYGAGWAGTDSLGQAFAISVDPVIQAERAFIIESQLLQDYHEPNPGQLSPVARYQTHVTIVDNNKAPLADQTVKVWADDPIKVQIDGKPSIPIDPTTAAVFTTDGTGSFSIVSDAQDLSMAPLRLWAAFMDPYERTVIYPDREFHNRLASTTGNVNESDPQKVNLATGTSYDGKPLCTNQTQAQQIAQAVQQMTRAVGLGAGGTSVTHGFDANAIASGKYIAYPDLPGLSYLPTNTPAIRPAAAVSPAGFSFTNLTFTSLSVADAASAIDALDGEETLLALGGFFDTIKHAWDEIKQGVEQKVAQVKQAVISVAEDIYVGLQYVINGVTKVAKAVVQDIEDVAAVIGSFFVQLGKGLEQVLEALSLFFDFGKILVTHRIIKGFFNDMMSNLGSYIKAIGPMVQNELACAESHLDDDIEQLIKRLDPPSQRDKTAAAKPISGLSGMGSSPHSVLSVSPIGSNQAQSHAVQSMWAVHKIRQNYQQATSPGSLSADPDPLRDFFTSFKQSLSTDPTLNQAYSQSKAHFSTKVTIASPAELLEYAIASLLEICKDIAVTGLAVVRALLDKLTPLADDIVDAFKNLGEIEIPVLSGLWKLITQDPNAHLSFVDMLALVAAIPVTYLYRAIAGSWPSATADGLLLHSSLLQHIKGIAVPVLYIIAGVLTALNDFLLITTQGLLTTGMRGKIVGAVLLLLSATNTVYTSVQHPDVGLAYENLGNLIAMVLLVLGPIKLGDPKNVIASWCNCFMSPLNIAYYAAMIDREASTTKLISDVLGQVPSFLNPIRLVPATTLVPFIAPVANLLFRLAQAGLTLADTITGWNQVADLTTHARHLLAER